MSKKTLSRGEALKMLAGGAAAVAGLGMIGPAKASEAVGSSEHQWVMVIDLDKCTGCGYCTLACQAHNDSHPDIHWNRVIEAGKVGDQDIFLARPCQHCDHAPCISVCPVKATYKRADGIVMMDYDRCIGCRYCEISCPYGARSFNWEEFTGDNPAVPEWGVPEVERRPRGVVEKCTFCVHRIDKGIELGLTPGVDDAATPACVVVCPVKARTFGDLNDPNSEVSKLLADNMHVRLREDLGVGPRVYYLTVR